MLPALLLSCALVAAAERELKPVGKLAEYTDAHGRGPRKSKKVQHVDAPLSADARPASRPRARGWACQNSSSLWRFQRARSDLLATTWRRSTTLEVTEEN